MKSGSLSNEPVNLSIDAFQSIALTAFEAFIQDGVIADHPSIYLEGKPGVGKSQSIHAIAHDLEKKTGKTVDVTDIRLLLFNPVDLRGIPVANADKTAAIWLKPYIFNMNGSVDHVNILFLDELTAAPMSIQAAAYQLVLDRQLGEHQLPKNTFVIAAGNGPKDGAVSNPMPSALKNRFIHYKIEENYTAWKTWAEDKIHPRILDFLERFPHEFSASSLHNDSNIVITPRSWEMLSKLLHRFPDDYIELETVIASVIGKRLAHRMLHEDTSLVQSIIEGKSYDMPSDIYMIHQVSEQLTVRLDEVMTSESRIESVLEFLLAIPLDYAIEVFKAIMRYDIVSIDLETLPTYQAFLGKLETSSDAL